MTFHFYLGTFYVLLIISWAALNLYLERQV